MFPQSPDQVFIVRDLDFGLDVNHVIQRLKDKLVNICHANENNL
jgi:hypothetical protein